MLPGIPKISAEDTVLKTTNAAGETVSIPVPAGSDILLDVAGIHYNRTSSVILIFVRQFPNHLDGTSARYWDDPYAFKPSRFLEDWPRDAFLAFSGGPRACIGRRFAEIEAMATMIMLVSRYSIEVMPDAQYAAETFEARRERILGADVRITLQYVSYLFFGVGVRANLLSQASQDSSRVQTAVKQALLCDLVSTVCSAFCTHQFSWTMNSYPCIYLHNLLHVRAWNIRTSLFRDDV